MQYSMTVPRSCDHGETCSGQREQCDGFYFLFILRYVTIHCCSRYSFAPDDAFCENVSCAFPCVPDFFRLRCAIAMFLTTPITITSWDVATTVGSYPPIHHELLVLFKLRRVLPHPPKLLKISRVVHLPHSSISPDLCKKSS